MHMVKRSNHVHFSLIGATGSRQRMWAKASPEPATFVVAD